LIPTADEDTGLAAPSATHPAVGTSIGTGTEVCAVNDSGTRRASCMTADDSAALAKIGAVTISGRRPEGTFDEVVAMTAPFFPG